MSSFPEHRDETGLCETSMKLKSSHLESLRRMEQYSEKSIQELLVEALDEGLEAVADREYRV